MCDNRRNPEIGFAIIEGKGVHPIRFSQWKMFEDSEAIRWAFRFTEALSSILIDFGKTV